MARPLEMTSSVVTCLASTAGLRQVTPVTRVPRLHNRVRLGTDPTDLIEVVHDGHEVEAGRLSRLRLPDCAIEQAVVGDTGKSEVGHVKPEQWIAANRNRWMRPNNSVTRLSNQSLVKP